MNWALIAVFTLIYVILRREKNIWFAYYILADYTVILKNHFSKQENSNFLYLDVDSKSGDPCVFSLLWILIDVMELKNVRFTPN